MHQRITTWAAVAAALLFSGSARAASLDYTGTLSFHIDNLPPIVFTGEDSGVSVSSGGGHFAIAPGVFQADGVLSTTLFTGVPTIDGLSFTLTNGTGTFSGAGGGIMPLSGTANVTLLKGFATLTVPLNKVGAGGPANPLARTPVGCEIGACSNTTTGTLMGVQVTGTAARWTTQKARITGVTFQTAEGFINTISTMGYDNRDAEHIGRIQFVSPVRVMAGVRVMGNDLGNIPAFSVLTLDFVPEPGTLVLLGAGAIGLAMVGMNRRKR